MTVLVNTPRINPGGESYPPEEDRLNRLASRWPQSSGKEREGIELSLWEAIVLPIFKGRRADNAQEGYIALRDSLDRWNPEKGSFRAYARQAIKRRIRDTWNSAGIMRIPSNVGREAARMRKEGIEPDSIPSIEPDFLPEQVSSTEALFDATLETYHTVSSLCSETVRSYFGIGCNAIPADELALAKGISVSYVYATIQRELEVVRRILRIRGV